jgi:hypothetical protein
MDRFFVWVHVLFTLSNIFSSKFFVLAHCTLWYLYHMLENSRRLICRQCYKTGLIIVRERMVAKLNVSVLPLWSCASAKYWFRFRFIRFCGFTKTRKLENLKTSIQYSLIYKTSQEEAQRYGDQQNDWQKSICMWWADLTRVCKQKKIRPSNSRGLRTSIHEVLSSSSHYSQIVPTTLIREA